MTSNQVKSLLSSKGIYCDTLSKSKGNFILRKGFFYTHGNDSYKIAQRIKEAFGNEIEIIETDDIWKPFRGGVTVAQGSHFKVVFNFK